MGTMTSIPTGEEYYRGRRDTVGQLFEAIDGDEYALRGTEYAEYDDPREALDELPLSVDVEKHVVVLLGTGGPHDEIDYNVTTGEATYYYIWGPESFRRTLSQSDPLYRLAQDYAEMVEE